MEGRKALGLYIQYRRKRVGVDQQELAKAIGRSPSNLSKIESGSLGLSFETAVAICRFIGISLEDLADCK